MKIRKLTYIAAIALAVGVLAGLPSVASAGTLTFGDAFDLGTIVTGEPASDAQEVIYANTLIGQPLNSSATIDGHVYTRTNASCGTCPAAVFNMKDETGGNVVDLGTGGFTYLLAKYDGPNGGDHLFNVQGMTGSMTIPLKGFGANNNKYGLSHFTLFGGGGQVPDGGSTVALLGFALLGLTALRAKFQKA